ncbi:hypothetical protein SANT12839_040600 [Streptomyces antimycoticus]|uniref:Uncharacterized protein n=1 Tax=Streptomyces antimycoticus TaxID=68175 RepID=A0A4D4K986_9ACTN|nr:hypothetical protein [Streptomyces antimycoticus]GDY43178.1 hypothetical protein SANT12839_040600 [Streptomyces antimycoticus]
MARVGGLSAGGGGPLVVRLPAAPGGAVTRARTRLPPGVGVAVVVAAVTCVRAAVRRAAGARVGGLVAGGPGPLGASAASVRVAAPLAVWLPAARGGAVTRVAIALPTAARARAAVRRAAGVRVAGSRAVACAARVGRAVGRAVPAARPRPAAGVRTLGGFSAPLTVRLPAAAARAGSVLGGPLGLPRRAVSGGFWPGTRSPRRVGVVDGSSYGWSAGVGGSCGPRPRPPVSPCPSPRGRSPRRPAPAAP